MESVDVRWHEMKTKFQFDGYWMGLIAIVLISGSASLGEGVGAEAWRVVGKTFTPMPRAADVVLLPSGRQLVAGMELGSNLLFRFDAESGQLLETRHTRESNPQCLVRVRGDILLVQDKGRTPEVCTLSPAELKQEGTLALPDFRLYRVASAATSQDGRYLWLSSCYTMSSLYGHVNSALFRVDLREGKCSLVRGPSREPVADRHVPNLALPLPSENNWLVSSTVAGEILVADIHTNRLLVFVGDSLEPAKTIETPFIPAVMPRECSRILPVAASEQIALVDLDAAKVTHTINHKGNPLSTCVSSDGRRAFISLSGSNDVLQIDLLTGGLLPSIDFSRTGGRRDFRDSSRGYDTFDIAVLRWADNPPRLIGLGYDGHILMIAQLAQTTGQTDPEQGAAPLPSAPRTGPSEGAR